MKIKLIQTVYASELKSRAILVMNYLIFRSNQAGTCFPAIKTIARECHIGVNTVKRALDDLVAAGYLKKEARFIETKNGAQTSNLYTLSEGMFSTDEIDAIPEEPGLEEETETTSGCCEQRNEAIEHETFEKMAQHVHSTDITNSITFFKALPIPSQEKCRCISVESAGFLTSAIFEWAGGQPREIPP